MKMRKLVELLAVVGISVSLFAGCAVGPRISSWQSPKRFTQKQVFDAAIQAGGQQGMQLTASDRESGTLSFRRSYGHDEMVLNATVKTVNDIVKVSTVAEYHGLAIHGLDEEVINNFHVYIFRNLGITDSSEQNVSITENPN